MKKQILGFGFFLVSDVISEVGFSLFFAYVTWPRANC